MDQTVGFSFPRGMNPRTIAEDFNAYLRGHEVFLALNPPTDADASIHGPFEKTHHGETSWQLDCSNDYWLRIFSPTNRAAISCRHPLQVPVIKAMVGLFTAIYFPTDNSNDTTTPPVS